MPKTVERPGSPERRTCSPTVWLHGLVEPYSETARVSRKQALARSSTRAGMREYVSSLAKRARRCVAFMNLAHDFGAGFLENVAHLHGQIVEEFAERRPFEIAVLELIL